MIYSLTYSIHYCVWKLFKWFVGKFQISQLRAAWSPNCGSRNLWLQYLCLSPDCHKSISVGCEIPPNFLASTLIQAGFDAGDFDMLGEVAELVIAQTQKGNLLTDRIFLFTSQLCLCHTKWNRLPVILNLNLEIDGIQRKSLSHLSACCSSEYTVKSANEMSNLQSFPGEKCRSFLYVAPSNERGKHICLKNIVACINIITYKHTIHTP